MSLKEQLLAKTEALEDDTLVLFNKIVEISKLIEKLPDEAVPTPIPPTEHREIDPVTDTQPAYVIRDPKGDWYVELLKQTGPVACLFIETVDEAGNPIDTELVIGIGSTPFEQIISTGEKGVGKVEYPIYRGEGQEGNRYCVIVVPESSSEAVCSLRVDINFTKPQPDDRTNGHVGYIIRFRRRAQ